VLVYSANLGDGIRLYARPFDQREARPLSGTEFAYEPFFSPDGRWIGFHDPNERKLKKVLVQGGQAQVVSDAWPPVGGTWLADGSIIFASQPSGAFDATGVAQSRLFRVPDTGGPPELLLAPDELQEDGQPTGRSCTTERRPP